MMLVQGFVPVISPIGLGDDASSIRDRPDPAAAAIAVARRAESEIYFTYGSPCLLEAGELVPTLAASDSTAGSLPAIVNRRQCHEGAGLDSRGPARSARLRPHHRLPPPPSRDRRAFSPTAASDRW